MIIFKEIGILFYLLCTISFKTSPINASQSLNRTLLNQHSQIKIGFSDDCITIRSDFKNDNKLVGKASVKTQSCTKEPSVEQSFKQIYYDEDDQNRFAICLSKYYNGPINAANWLPRFWCLIGNKNFVKVLKAKSLSQIKDDLKFQWSYNEESKLINHNLNGRFMNINRASKIKLSPMHLSTINNFGSHSISNSNIDYCANNPCQNDAICINKKDSEDNDSYSCSCREGWEGAYCQTNIDDCAANPCENGSCEDGVNKFTCRCETGWEGELCDTNIDDCIDNPCNNGICFDEIGGYSCQCHPGWKGDNCTEISGICESKPCQNNGTCSKIADGFNCKCQSSWLGIFCTFKEFTNDSSEERKKEDKGIATPQIGPHGPSQLIKGPCQDHKKAKLNGACRDIPANGLTKCGVVSDKKNDIGLLKSNSNKTEDLTRIYGGSASTISQWPWQISVRIWSEDRITKKHHCGGSVINSNYVISAAHCFKDGW